jgi:uncharacterized protein YndB with AHSA1/START domain
MKVYELSLNKRCKAPVERIFAAWSTPEQMQRWFAPGDMKVAEASADFRVGGAWRVVMQRPDGHQHIVGGVYREIEPNQRLLMSWSWEGSGVTSEIEILLQAAGEQTDLTLNHRQIPTAESRDSHAQGWEGCLAKLVQLD